MIKIAYVINYIVQNGPSRVVLTLINNLDRAKYAVSLITLFQGNDPAVVKRIKEAGISVFECTTLTRAGCILGADREFKDILERENFDILHTHGFIPDILSSRLTSPLKRITTIHNNMYEDYLDCYGFFKSRLYIWFHLQALKKLEVCVCCSKSVYDVMRQKLDNVIYIRNGISPAKAHSVVTRHQLGLPENARVFLYAGILNSRKNIVWLIKEFVKCHHDNDYFLVLGRGDKENECKSVSDDHVKMLGFQEDIAAYMHISNIYISASVSEGFSISVLEALSCGLGLFLSDIPSHREIVSMGESIYIGEIFSMKDFPRKMNILRSKKFEPKKISEFLERELSATAMAKQYNEVYTMEGNC